MDNGFNGHFKDLLEDHGRKLTALEKYLSDMCGSTAEIVLEMRGVKDEIKSLHSGLLGPATSDERTHKAMELNHKLYMVVIRTLCWLLGLIILWFTGLKGLMPHIF